MLTSAGWERDPNFEYRGGKLMTYKDQNGFTLLELIISIAIIAVIAGIAMGGMRLGISARDISENKVDLYMRLRFIGEQISEKIKSVHPLFLKEKNNLPEGFFETKNTEAEGVKLLLFEGKPQSIRFITFSNALSLPKNPPWMHETQIFLGTNLQTQENGLILMERDILLNDIQAEPDPRAPGVRYITLANDVAFLEFHYYKMSVLTPEELKDQGYDFEKSESPTVQRKGEWIDTIIIQSPEQEEKEALFAEEQKNLELLKKNRISPPRAIEISLGLNQKSTYGAPEVPEVYYLPPTIFPLNVGTEFARPPEEEEGDEKA